MVVNGLDRAGHMIGRLILVRLVKALFLCCGLLLVERILCWATVGVDVAVPVPVAVAVAIAATDSIGTVVAVPFANILVNGVQES